MAASTSRRLRRIIKEYINAAETKHPELKQLKEFFGRDLTKDSPVENPEPWEGLINQKREVVLKALGAQPFKQGINPHGYQLDVDVSDPTGQSRLKKQDRLWFYDNGTAWSTNQVRNLYYSAAANKILLYTDEQSRNTKNQEHYAGDITKLGNRAVFNLSGIEQGEKPLTTGEKVSDWGHTVLDWIGFVPGIGDIADIVNAIWYFVEGDTFEGFLSLIAVLPIVGSGIKVAIKGAIDVANASVKGFRRALRTSLKTGNTYEVWNAIVNSGKFSKADLRDLGTGLDSLRGILNKSTDALRPLPGGNKIADQLDDFSKWLTDSRKQINELTGVSKTAADKLAAKGATLNKTITKATDTGIAGARKVLSIVPAVKAEGLFKRIRGLAWFPEKKLLALAKGMERRFVKEMSHPGKLTALVKTTPNPELLVREMMSDIRGFDNVVRTHFPTWFFKNRSGANVLAPNAQLDDIIHRARNSKQFNSMFNDIAKNHPDIWARVTEDVSKHAMKNDSMVWNLYKTDALKSLKTALDPRYMKEWDFSFRKNVDIIYNELHDMGEDITKDEIRDNPTGVVYPIIKSGLNQVLPGKTVKDVQKFRDDVAANPMVKAGLAAAGYSVKDGTILKTSDLNYDPFGEAGGDLR
jgi:hypothetical protein